MDRLRRWILPAVDTDPTHQQYVLSYVLLIIVPGAFIVMLSQSSRGCSARSTPTRLPIPTVFLVIALVAVYLVRHNRLTFAIHLLALDVFSIVGMAALTSGIAATDLILPVAAIVMVALLIGIRSAIGYSAVTCLLYWLVSWSDNFIPIVFIDYLVLIIGLSFLLVLVWLSTSERLRATAT